MTCGSKATDRPSLIRFFTVCEITHEDWVPAPAPRYEERVTSSNGSISAALPLPVALDERDKADDALVSSVAELLPVLLVLL